MQFDFDSLKMDEIDLPESINVTLTTGKSQPTTGSKSVWQIWEPVRRWPPLLHNAKTCPSLFCNVIVQVN